MAGRVHDPGTVPEGRAPPAPVLVCPEGVEHEPAALHFGVAQRPTAQAGHLRGVQRQVHVLGGIAVQVVHTQRAAALGKRTARIGVRAARRPAPALASGRLLAAGRADPAPIGGPIGPGLVGLAGRVVGRAHPGDRRRRSRAARQIEAVVRRFEPTLAGALPLVRIAQPLAHRLADLRGLAGADPDHRVLAGDAGKLEPVDAGARLLGALGPRVVQGRHLGPAADPGGLGEHLGALHGLDRTRPALLRSHRMPGDRRVALPREARPAEHLAHRTRLPRGQPMHPLDLGEHPLVALGQRGRRPSDRCRQREQHHEKAEHGPGPRPAHRSACLRITLKKSRSSAKPRKRGTGAAPVPRSSCAMPLTRCWTRIRSSSRT